MADRIGGGLESLAQLKTAFDRHAGQVDELRMALSGQLANTDWEGPAAARFQNAWSSDFEPSLRRLRAALDECSTEVMRRRQALIDAGG